MKEKTELTNVLTQWIGLFQKRSISDFILLAKENEMSLSQLGALLYIRRKQKSGITDIGDVIGVTSAAASQLIDRLVRRGLLYRREDPENRRAKQIILTEEGDKVTQEILETRQNWLTALVDDLSAEELKLTLSVLKILVKKTATLSPQDIRLEKKHKENFQG